MNGIAIRLAALALSLWCGGTNASTALPPPAVPPESALPAVAAIKLSNPGFESTAPGKLGAPDGWWAVQHAGPTSYAFTLDTASKHSGERSLRIDNVGPEPFGSIYQKADAAPLRGKTLRLAAWIRTEATTGTLPVRTSTGRPVMPCDDASASKRPTLSR